MLFEKADPRHEHMEVYCAICNEDDMQYSLWKNNKNVFMFLEEYQGNEMGREHFYNFEALLEECQFNNNLRRLVEIFLDGGIIKEEVTIH
jgi:hypothetical protein